MKDDRFVPDYLNVPYPIYRDERLEGADRLVYGIIYWFETMKNGKCTASNDSIASVIGINPRSVKNSLNRLEECGYIQRTYKDEAHRHRLEIHAMISFKKMSQRHPNGKLEGKVDASTEGKVDAQIHNTNTDKDIAGQSPAPAEPFNSEKTKAKWYDGDDARFQLLAWFFDQKGLWRRLDSKPKVEDAVKRHLRAATRLIKADWSQDECKKALGRMIEANPKMREEWTLDTLLKYLTK